MSDYNEISQLQTRIAILESQLQVKETALGGQRAEIERLTNLVGTLLKKEEWDGQDIGPTLEFK
tara:strand:+ start:451 stop:642 length:192 start_codon:yes stop_codon:yes gene_type:complete